MKQLCHFSHYSCQKAADLTKGEASCDCQLVAGKGGVKVMDPLVKGEWLDLVLTQTTGRGLHLGSDVCLQHTILALNGTHLQHMCTYSRRLGTHKLVTLAM